MTNNSPQIEIPIDKTKLRGLLIAALIFVVLGIIFMLGAPFFRHVTFGIRAFIFFGGLLSVSFFGYGANIFSKKLTSNLPGLVIGDLGFTDNSSGVSAGFVAWGDIVELRERAVNSQVFLLIIVRNPEEYINRQSGGFKKFMMRMNLKFYKTPISISANTLQIDFYQMRKLFEDKINNFWKS